ncbi:MAG TPA: hypothetical protein VKK79_23550 [Candidatus Lokiarchaeia archaeon]|nr:hypothetical protein [Candidatus Lokiarchaeia archaeon]
MNEAEWRKVLAGITSEDAQEREDTYELVGDKFWNDEVLDKLKENFDGPEVTLGEKIHYSEAVAAIGLEKGIPFLTKKRADLHSEIKELGEDSLPDDDRHLLLANIDDSLKSVIARIKKKKEISLKNLVQKNFALK